MTLARIVGSNSHLDYVARIAAPGEGAAEARVFGQFVRIEHAGETVVGVIYDSRLISPEFGGFGPRLQPRPALEDFGQGSERGKGVLIGIILLGTLGKERGGDHTLPGMVIPAGTDAELLSEDEMLRFHGLPGEMPEIGYYSRIVSHSGQFAGPLIESIIERLKSHASPAAAARLDLVRQSINWQATVGGPHI